MALPDSIDPNEADLPPSDPATDPPSGKPVAWKAAASSIPRLSQVTAVSPEAEPDDPFPGFAQDALVANAGAPPSGGSEARRLLGSDADLPTLSSASGPPWAQWMEQLKAVPPPLLIGLGVVIVAGLVTFIVFGHGDGPSVSLGQILQHPEAYEGRSVTVGGVAGEAFAVGNSYVYDLRQSRDTIVVYSRKRRPALHERVLVEGTVSIGYMDGAPRVALLENPN